MIDLHCHSHYSDGALSPSDLLQKALANGVKILALTDHDSMSGLPELHEAARAYQDSIRIINGIELSTIWKKYDIHILGLNVKAQDKALEELIKKQKILRSERAQEIGLRLKRCGVDNAYEKALELAAGGQVGRPHFAKVLMNENLVNTMQAAFSRFLGKSKPAFVPTRWISLEEAVSGIKAAGGDAVIAHPHKYGLTRTKLHELILRFKDAGGAGMEVVSGMMEPGAIKEMAGLCLRFDLLASTGSDFHGEQLSSVGLGRQAALPNNCLPVWNQWNESCN